MVLRYLSSRRHRIDDLRQHLRHAVRRLGGRNSELLRDLPELALTEDLLDDTRIDWEVRAGADPRLRLLAITCLLKPGENALKAAVLLQQLQRHEQQWILRLRAGAAQRATGRVVELAAHRTSCIAAQYAAEDRVENSHGPSRMCEGRSLRCDGGKARQPPPSAVRMRSSVTANAYARESIAKMSKFRRRRTD